MRVGVVHGPNLTLLGTREPAIYGSATLEQIDAALATLGRDLGVELTTRQSDLEGELVQIVHSMAPEVDGLLVNAAAYTHTSLALRDALLAVDRPFVEVHLSNVFAREAFRHHSYLADRAVGMVAGFGPNSYLLGLRALAEHLRGAELPTT